MPTCLVTGGGGFTGRYLIAHLKNRGHRVVALSRQPCGADETHPIELGDRTALHRLLQRVTPQQLYHLAALSFVGHPEPLDFYRVNVLGTENLLDAAAALPAPPHLLLVSSANVYGSNACAVIDESVLPAPVNHYAVSKLAMEQLVRTRADDLPILVVRPFNYTGPGQAPHFLVPKLVRHFRRGAAEIELGNTAVSRDFSDVRDVVAIYSRLLDEWPAVPPAERLLNVGSGTAVPLQHLIDRLARLTGHRPRIRIDPALVRRSEILELRACTRRLESWLPGLERRPLEETLADMLQAPPGKD